MLALQAQQMIPHVMHTRGHESSVLSSRCSPEGFESMPLYWLTPAALDRFAVPFEEDDKDTAIWFLDHNYHEQMFSMFKKINGKVLRYPLNLSQL